MDKQALTTEVEINKMILNNKMTKKVNTLSLTPGYTGGRPNEFRYNLGSELKNGLFYRPDKKKKKKNQTSQTTALTS